MHDSVSTGRRTKRWAGAAGLLAAGANGVYEVHMKKADLEGPLPRIKDLRLWAGGIGGGSLAL